jgi:adenylate cyclase
MIAPAHPPSGQPTLPYQPTAASTGLLSRLAGRPSVTVALVLVVLAGLPVAVWLDMRDLSQRALLDQANDLTSMLNNIRDYYASNVVGRVLAAHGVSTQVLPNYASVPGAIPIPATLSLELGDVINADNGNMRFRFFSDYPFKSRAPHIFDTFERDALQRLRQDPSARPSQAGLDLFIAHEHWMPPPAPACVGFSRASSPN